VILDTLANAHRYHSLGKGIVRALEYLAKAETARLEPKQTGAQNSLVRPIVGDDVYALVQRSRPQLRHKAFWEAHRKYIDVQCVFEGEEMMGWAPLETMGVSKPYDEERDYVVLESLQGTRDGDNGRGAVGDPRREQFFTVSKGMFAIFFPSDAHMPGIAPNDNLAHEVKKIVVKVRI
jgi:biofilm protein TabA